MKTLNWIFFFAAMVTGLIASNGQSVIDAEVPGDNFSLEGALELFKKSDSPETFERLLNLPDSKVNNLDLNNDGNTDYIKVIDRNEGNVHAFILQAVISRSESQDIAVIELEKLQNGEAVLQITGDADVYGIETIIEPSDEVRVNAGTSTVRTVVNVWAWPSVQYVYSPYYDPWISPWAWSYSPIWWRPWSPVAFHVYNPWWRPYRSYYSFCYSHRIGYLPVLYQPYRTTSVYVYNNCNRQISQYRSNYDGRSRSGRYDDGRSSGRDHYEGYGGRTRSDYDHRDNSNNSRYASNTTRSRNQSYASDRTRMNERQSQSTGRTTSSDRPTVTRDRSSSNFRSSSEQIRGNGNANSQPRNMPVQRNFNQSEHQRQSPASFSRGQQQRSSQSNNVGQQQRSVQSSGSSRSMSSGGVGTRSTGSSMGGSNTGGRGRR